MKCLSPYVTNTQAYGCGQCVPCRALRRRVWAHRMQMEAKCHAENSFVTLTYAGDAYSLNPKDTQDWLKRFRKAIEPRKVRYFLVGEYGDTTQRPHYHAVIFGFGHCRGNVWGNRTCQCVNCSVVRATWGFGHVQVGNFSDRAANYIAKYTLKKMTSRDDLRLHGREPEFARMSLRPGIGAPAMWDVVSEMLRYGSTKTPTALRHGPLLQPLGRYLRRKISEWSCTELGTEEFQQNQAKALSLLREYAAQNEITVLDAFRQINEGNASNIEARALINRGRL